MFLTNAPENALFCPELSSRVKTIHFFPSFFFPSAYHRDREWRKKVGINSRREREKKTYFTDLSPPVDILLLVQHPLLPMLTLLGLPFNHNVLKRTFLSKLVPKRQFY